VDRKLENENVGTLVSQLYKPILFRSVADNFDGWQFCLYTKRVKTYRKKYLLLLLLLLSFMCDVLIYSCKAKSYWNILIGVKGNCRFMANLRTIKRKRTTS